MAAKPLYDPDLWHKLEERTIPEPNSGCLLWLGAVNQDGYGSVGIPGTGKTTSAHRRAWFSWNGPIPTGQQVLHKCDVPSCISPNHLWLGTHKENMADRDRKGRCGALGGPHGAENQQAKLTEADVRAIRVASGTQRDIAKHFGVHFQTVNDILIGRTWKHLLLEPIRRGHAAKITADDVRAIRLAAKTATQRVIAKRYGITFKSVSDIMRGKTWRYVP